MDNKVFHHAVPVLTTLRSAGYQAYFVGGAVRNMLLNLPVNDIDITTDALPDEVEHLFEKTVPIGKEHGTILVLLNGSYEVTTFRQDGEYKDHRRPTDVQFVNSLTEDLIRRDFTINALALNEKMEVIDKVEGLNDIEHRLIRAVGDADKRFEEDALRMIRACRFQSVLDFEIEDSTYDALVKQADSIRHVAIERTMKEIIKLIEGTVPYKGFNTMIGSGLINYIPILNDIADVPKPHQAVSYQSYFGYLMYEHSIDSLSELKLSRKDIQLAKEFSTLYPLMIRPLEADELMITVYRYGSQKVEQAAVMLSSIQRPISISLDHVKKIEQQLPIKSRNEMTVDGLKIMNHLSKKPGPWLKTLLSELEQQIVTRKIKNNEDELLRWIESHVEV